MQPHRHRQESPPCTPRRSTTLACGSTTCQWRVEWLTAQGVRFAPGGIRQGAAGFDNHLFAPQGQRRVPHRRRGCAGGAGAGAARGGGRVCPSGGGVGSHAVRRFNGAFRSPKTGDLKGVIHRFWGAVRGYPADNLWASVWRFTCPLCTAPTLPSRRPSTACTASNPPCGTPPASRRTRVIGPLNSCGAFTLCMASPRHEREHGP